MVIHGADDALIGVSGGEATAGAIPGPKLVVIPGLGHDLPPSALERIAAALVDELRTRPRAGRCNDDRRGDPRARAATSGPIGWGGKRLDRDARRVRAAVRRDRLLRRADRRARAQGLASRSSTRSCSPGCAAVWSRRARRRSTSPPRRSSASSASSASRSTRPEGDSIALSTGIIVHVHTMSDAIKWMVRQGYEDNPRIRPGDIFANNDPTIGDVHNADVQTFVPIFMATRPSRAGRLGRRGHPRARHRRLDAGRRPGRSDPPPRRRHRPPLHEDRRARRDRALAPRALREADPGADVLPARRAHPARRLPHDPRGGRAGDRGGGARALQELQPRGDRGGPAVVQEPDPRDDRAGPLPGRLVHGQHLRRQGPAAGAGAARLRHARAVRGPDRRRRRLRARPRRHLGLGLALDELHPVRDAGRDLGDVHPDADLQRQGQRRRLLRGRDQLPGGLDREPRRRRRLDRDRLGVPAAGVHRLSANAVASAAGARASSRR